MAKMYAGARKPSRNARKWMLGLALIICPAFIIVCLPEKRTLLQQSTRVATIRDWWIGPHFWLSDHQILFSRNLAGPPGLYRLDIRTGKENYLKPLSQEVERADFLLCQESIRVSPDGSRLLWQGFEDQAMHGAWLDGSHYFTCNPPPQVNASRTTALWTSDSRRWVAFVSCPPALPQAMVYDGDASRKPLSIPTVTSDRSDPLDSMCSRSTQSLVFNSRVLAWSWYAHRSAISDVDVVDIGLDVPAAALKTHRIRLPSDASGEEVEISPKGDRVALLLTMPGAPAWRRLLQRLFPRIPVNTHPVESLWACNVDETDLHEIGSRTLEHAEKFEPQLYHLRWMSGSALISYRYRDSLYTVSAK